MSETKRKKAPTVSSVCRGFNSSTKTPLQRLYRDYLLFLFLWKFAQKKEKFIKKNPKKAPKRLTVSAAAAAMSAEAKKLWKKRRENENCQSQMITISKKCQAFT